MNQVSQEAKQVFDGLHFYSQKNKTLNRVYYRIFVFTYEYDYERFAYYRNRGMYMGAIESEDGIGSIEFSSEFLDKYPMFEGHIIVRHGHGQFELLPFEGNVKYVNLSRSILHAIKSVRDHRSLGAVIAQEGNLTVSNEQIA